MLNLKLAAAQERYCMLAAIFNATGSCAGPCHGQDNLLKTPFERIFLQILKVQKLLWPHCRESYNFIFHLKKAKRIES